MLSKPTLLTIILDEARAVLQNPAVMAVVVGALIVYALLYPLPYSRQVVLQQPIVVVDLDQSALSRALIRKLSASPEAQIIGKVESIGSARNLLSTARADSFYDHGAQLRGFMVIPHDFERLAIGGHSPTLSFAGDASAFLSYGAIVQAMVNSANQIADDLRFIKLSMSGEYIDQNQNAVAPIHLRPLYNHNMTYLNYILPAVFIFILHQLILMSAALHGCWQRQNAHADALSGMALAKVLLARVIVFGTLFNFGIWFYFAISFQFYQIPLSGTPWAWMMLFAPFITSCVMLGSFIGQLIPQPKYAPAILLLSAAPLLFSTGFIWPIELVPTFLLAPIELIPSTSAIHSFLKLTQMQADVAAIGTEILKMWGLAIFYFLLILIVAARR